jgi:signal transduction histidine kinase
VRDWWVGPVADVAIPVGLLALGTVELAGMSIDGRAWGVLLEAVASALLVFRRRWPLVASTLAQSALLTMPLFGPQLDDPATPILYLAVSTYALARWRADLRGLFGVAAIVGLFVVLYTLVDERDHNVSDAVFILSLILPPFAAGRLVRRLEDRSRLLEANQELVKEAAVRDERDRIARELHDVIAHSVSAMVVQTAAAQDLVRTDPDAAESVLADVAATGRRALAETGRLLHVIRDTQGELGLAPVPGLAEVPDLVERFRADGLDVDLHIDTTLPALPAGVDVSAYRIVQEALTNALRYSLDGSARLEVSGSGGLLRIHAANRCNGHPPGRQGSGLGLIGMKERVSVLGGSLSHGVAAPGLFEVDATLPVES